MGKAKSTKSKVEKRDISKDTARALKKEMTVGDIMRAKTVACREDTTAIDVAQIMVVHRVRYCFVLNNRDELVGVIAAKSLQSAAGPKLESTVARDVMLPTICTIKREMTIRQAAAEMHKNKVQHLVVISDHPNLVAVGIIGATDILKHMVTQ